VQSGGNVRRFVLQCNIKVRGYPELWRYREKRYKIAYNAEVPRNGVAR
jgi:hypothetical protein